MVDFIEDEIDKTKFEALDWVMKIASAKWEAYSIERRIKHAS
jgi:hypothetical protein